MHTEMWEHPAVVENLATLRRRGVHVVEPGVGRLAGGDVGAGRLADPADIVAAAERILGPGRPRRRHASSSPPAAPASRSTPCGSSPTAAPASRATPSPPRPRPGAPTSCSSAPSTCRRRRRARRAPSRRRPRCRPPSSATPDADVIVMAAAVADFRPKAGRRRASSRSTTACPRSCSSRRPTSSPASARPSGRARCSSASPPRPTTSSPTPRPSSRAKRLDLIVANDVARARRRASATTPTPSYAAAARTPIRSPSTCATSGRSPAPSSTPSSTIRSRHRPDPT